MKPLSMEDTSTWDQIIRILEEHGFGTARNTGKVQVEKTNIAASKKNTTNIQGGPGKAELAIRSVIAKSPALHGGQFHTA